ncbi:MAG: IS21 family transposase [Alkaliphilus sp.]
MIILNKKRKVLLMYEKGHNKTEIAKEVTITRKTVRKYINEYEKKLDELAKTDVADKEKIDLLVEELSNPAKYDSSNRACLRLTDEIKEVVNECLKENDEKVKNRNKKQIMKGIDIHELVTENGFDIGYTTICNYIRNQKKSQEAYVKQLYPKGNTLEYDWGEVKLEIAGGNKRFQMALLTTASGSCHYAKLYHNQKMESFLDSHIKAFKYFDGVHKEVVYDNMKVAVKRFVSKTEKEATEDLIKISMYYGFNYRFCSAGKGNEKGHVERGIEFVRRKAFSRTYKFDTLEDANRQLLNILEKLNTKERKWLEGKSPRDVLIEERKYLKVLKPDYVIARKVECRVDKYSTIRIEQNRYSVPEYLVGKFTDVTVYPERIKVEYRGDIVAKHSRSFRALNWSMDINHYLETIKKKPGSLKSSAAIHHSDRRIQNIYNNYYNKKPKEFIDLLEIIKEKELETIEAAIRELDKLGKRHVTTEKIKNLVNQVVLESNDTKNKQDDEIKEKSMEMLDKLTNALLNSTNGRMIH